MNQPIGLWRNIGLIFFIVSGGAYGLEALVGAVGPAWAIILVLIVPLFWVLPTALMVMELTAKLPEKGGYYSWVKAGLGRKWGFQEGWWTLCYSAVDLAIYPVLFVTYLSFFIPSLHDPMVKWLVSASFIGISLCLNFLGVAWLGRGVLTTLLLVTLPFLIMSYLGFCKGRFPPIFAQHQFPILTAQELSSGLAIILWNYCGWDNISTYIHEVHQPSRTYIRSILATLLLIMLSYLIPLLAGFHVSTDPKLWGESSGWPTIAESIGGPLLGALIAGVALFSTSSQFSSQLLYLSRLIIPMAEDGWLPKILVQKKTKTNEPVGALIALGLLAALCSALSFTKLVVVDILFYTLGLSLEFAALIALRKSQPVSSFKIPLNIPGLIFLSLMPLSMALIVAASTLSAEGGKLQAMVVIFGIALGLLIQKYNPKASAGH